MEMPERSSNGDSSLHPFDGCSSLWRAIQEHWQRGYASFHLPGHKGARAAIWQVLRERLGHQALETDLTELPGLDDLHAPRGPILRAEEMAARVAGAGRSFFLVNGVTAGLQAALMGLLQPGDTVLVPRQFHRSVFGGLVLSGAHPVYLPVCWQYQWGMPLGPAPKTLTQALDHHPEARLVVLVSPTYEGVVPPLAQLVTLAHSRGVPVLVDEAHGSHFGLAPGLPPSALAAGADVVVQGWHKTLGSLTQTAVVHIRRGYEDQTPRLESALRLLQTTSPSYLFLVSLEAAAELALKQGPEDWRQAVELALASRRFLTGPEGCGLQVLGKEQLLAPESTTGGTDVQYGDGQTGISGPIWDLDPCRLVLSADGLGLDGPGLAHCLRTRYRIQVEMAAKRYVVLILTPGDEPAKVETLLIALRDLVSYPWGGNPARPGAPGNSSGMDPLLEPWPIPAVRLWPAEAFYATRERVPLEQAAGRMAAELVAPYPPGIPLILPGEEISQEILARLLLLREGGWHCQGLSDRSLRTIEVIIRSTQ